MIKSFLLVAMCALQFSLTAQMDTADNYVKKFATIPEFNLQLFPDAKPYTNKNLKKGKPLVIMFFSPGCDHCEQQTKELLAHKKDLVNIPILMISIAPMAEIKTFYQTFGLSSMPNIKVVRDQNLAMASTYRLQTYPSLYIYDNKGSLAKAFVGNIGIPAVLKALN